MEKKLVFLLYDARSGSTLLSALLNRYRGISVSQESTFVHRIIEFKGKIHTDHLDEIFRELSKEVQFTELHFDTEKFIGKIKDIHKGNLSKKELIELIMVNYFEQRDDEAQVQIQKLGDYLYIKEILEMFPNAFFLQIIRDGRAVFNSKKNNYSFEGELQDTNPLHAAWNWTQKLKKSEFYQTKFITVRYEDLIKDPEPTLNHVLDKLDLPGDLREKTKKQEDYFHDLGMRQKPLHQNVEKKPQVDFAYKWKEQLTDKEIMVFTYRAEDYLEKYGYETNGYRPTMASIYSFQYLMLYIFKKTINVLKLLKSPSLLKIKLKRKIRMILRE